MTDRAEVETESGRTFFGHPFGLLPLSALGVWERFSFYGMQVCLLFYLYFSVADGGLGLPQATATSLVGAYGGVVYLSTVLGAWVADRLLGAERTLFYSCVTVVIGHVVLAVVPGIVGVGIGLILVSLGGGGHSANNTASIGLLYGTTDQRRDGGFMLFYMFLNIGAIAGPILSGLARTTLGFHYAFGIAAIGMAIGLAIYGMGRRRHLSARGRSVPDPLPRARLGRVIGAGLGIVAVIAIGVTTGVVTPANLAMAITAVVLILAVGYFTVMLRSAKVSALERRRVLSLIPMFLVASAFWALYQQQFTLVQIYAGTRIELDVFGFATPPEFFTSVVPVFVIVCAPVFVALWTKLGTRQPSTPAKFLIGILCIGGAFLLFLPMSGSQGPVNPPLALVGILLVFTLAELFVSPESLSVATKLAPRAFRSQVVALLFLPIAAGSSAAGVLAGLYSPQHEATYFWTLGVTALVVGGLFALTIPLTRRLMSGVH